MVAKTIVIALESDAADSSLMKSGRGFEPPTEAKAVEEMSERERRDTKANFFMGTASKR